MLRETKIKNRKPYFSIIIPAFNEGHWPKETIEGILADNSFADYEIILIDDGSDDNCCDFVNHERKFIDLQKKGNIIFVQTKDAGTAGTRHIGALSARGDTLIFIDAHMQVEAGWLSQIYETIESRPEIKILGINIHSIGNPKPLKKLFAIYTSKDITFISPKFFNLKPPYTTEIAKVPFVAAGALLIKRNVYFEIGGFPEYLEGWGGLDRALSLTAYYYGYDCYHNPQITIGHYFKPAKNIPQPMLKKMYYVYYNSLAISYVLFDEEYHRRVMDIVKGKNCAQKIELFYQKLPILEKIRAKIKSEEKRTFQNFRKDFQPYLEIFDVSDYQQAVNLRSEDPDRAKLILHQLEANIGCHQKTKNNLFLSMIYFRLAHLYHCESREKALSYSFKSLTLNSSYVPLFELISMLYIELNYPDKSLEYAMNGLELFLKNGHIGNEFDSDEYHNLELNFYDLLSYAYFQKFEFDKALKICDKAMQLEPNLAERMKFHEICLGKPKKTC